MLLLPKPSQKERQKKESPCVCVFVCSTTVFLSLPLFVWPFLTVHKCCSVRTHLITVGNVWLEHYWASNIALKSYTSTRHSTNSHIEETEHILSLAPYTTHWTVHGKFEPLTSFSLSLRPLRQFGGVPFTVSLSLSPPCLGFMFDVMAWASIDDVCVVYVFCVVPASVPAWFLLLTMPPCVFVFCVCACVAAESNNTVDDSCVLCCLSWGELTLSLSLPLFHFFFFSKLIHSWRSEWLVNNNNFKSLSLSTLLQPVSLSFHPTIFLVNFSWAFFYLFLNFSFFFLSHSFAPSLFNLSFFLFFCLLVWTWK